LIRLLHPEPVTGQTLVLEAATPAAINATMFALEFGTEPDIVSGITLISTLLSLVTVTGWIWYLR
ncbi:MAG: AEC family transporter, partial [Mycobacterium leprae]